MKSPSFFKSLKTNTVLILQGARIHTLPAILIPIALSGAWAFHQTAHLNKRILLFTALSALFIQIALNVFNDSSDFTEGTDKPESLTSTKKLSLAQIWSVSIVCCGIAFVLALPLIARGGWPILLLGLVSFVLAYLYTGTRFSLIKLGLSELVTFLFFGPMVVIVTYYLQTLSWDIGLVYLGIQCGLWSVSLLLINYLRDEKEDLQIQRKHVVTLYGREHSLLIFIVVQAFIYLLCFYWLGLGLKSGAFSFFIAPFSMVLVYFVCNSPPSKKYTLYLALNSLLYIAFGLAWMMGLFLF